MPQDLNLQIEKMKLKVKDILAAKNQELVAVKSKRN